MASASPEPTWTIARSDHFEIYTQADSETVRSAITWFEQLWTFFEQSGLEWKQPRPVRVIGFRSRREFDSYRIPAAADAYYIGTVTRDYIVMPGLGTAEFVTAAHEYTHARLHASGLRLPSWLSEGLADFFSTVHISERESEVGGELPMRIDVLRHNAWMPLAQLFAAAPTASGQPRRQSVASFYAQSWALTEMLALSDGYRPRFRELVNKVGSGMTSAEGLRSVYSKSLDQVEADLRKWVNGDRFKPVRLPGVTSGSTAVAMATASRLEAELMLADLALAAGELDRAEGLYGELVRESPENGEAWAALGTIALHKGKALLARQDWRRAMDDGVADAQLCYRYAELEDKAGADADEMRRVLQRVVELEPGFDDARYKLALLENNTGRYQEALTQLKAMHEVIGARAYGYWTAVAYALEELGRRDEAKRAAAKAMESAGTPDEREHARQLAYMAATDLGVQFTRDAKGQLQMMTTRVPHGASDWNPFVEPGDQMRRVEGRLLEIRCDGAKATGLAIATANGTLQVAIADPTQVEMRNAPAEFTCGPQTGTTVMVDYAVSTKAGAQVAGVARGLEFR